MRGKSRIGVLLDRCHCWERNRMAIQFRTLHLVQSDSFTRRRWMGVTGRFPHPFTALSHRQFNHLSSVRLRIRLLHPPPTTNATHGTEESRLAKSTSSCRFASVKLNWPTWMTMTLSLAVPSFYSFNKFNSTHQSFTETTTRAHHRYQQRTIDLLQLE